MAPGSAFSFTVPHIDLPSPIMAPHHDANDRTAKDMLAARERTAMDVVAVRDFLYSMSTPPFDLPKLMASAQTAESNGRKSKLF